jgi:uncharacterized protein YodC (DUF2158 family)
MKVGDVVVLKSDPLVKMTVSSMPGGGSDSVRTQWFVGGALYSGYFLPDELMLTS